jgi:FlaA1/EpsC-like NDP-sugar epimerase
MEAGMTGKLFDGKRVLITGGTGSMGKVLVRRLLGGSMGDPEAVIVFSRDEAKQYFMRVEYENRVAATDEVVYRNFQKKLQFWIGDVRDFNSVASALRGVDVVVNASAMKQVPTCEYFPYEAVRTNIEGAENIVCAIQKHNLQVETVVGVSTDKACKPVNAMGMTKALQERVFIQGNMRCSRTRFVCVRYGNVLASRGSVIPLFHEQIRNGGPVTITTPEMTRFLLSLEDAGFCEKGKGMSFVADHDLTFRGDFPVNTAGGQLSFGQAGMAGGMHHVVDGARQVMGRSGDAHVVDCNTAFVTGNGGIMSEQVALILGGD